MPYGMYIAAAGAQAQSERMKVLSNNLANVDTPGFSRQRAVLAPSPALLTGGGHLGTGVDQLTIQRISDVFVQAQLK